MSERREWGVLDMDASMYEPKVFRPMASTAFQPLPAAGSDRVEATRRWAVETLLDRFGSANLKDAEAMVQYVLHGRTEA